MTDETDLPFSYGETPATPTGAKPWWHRHVYDGYADGDIGRALLGEEPLGRCRCGAIQDPAASRRGKSAARLGKDQERAFEREHGPTKIGERGDPVDHLGRFGKYQVKSTRGAVPARLRHIDRMEGLYGDRVPILVERFVRHGVRTETFLTMRLKDWQAVHGRDEE